MPTSLQPCDSQLSGAVPWESHPVHGWEEVKFACVYPSTTTARQSYPG